MRLPTARRPRRDSLPGVTGPVRLDRRTDTILKRLRPGDVAVISHVDLDRTSAEGLVDRGVAAVVNAAESLSGRYPSLGPQVLVAAGIALVDAVGEAAFGRLREGDIVRVHDGTVYVGDQPVANGDVLDEQTVAERTQQARAGMVSRLEAFTLDSADYLRREHELLIDGVGVPTLTTALTGRHVVVVSATHDHRADLKALRGYLRDRHPVLIGVDAGADALLQAGHAPDLAVGDPELMSDAALRRAREVVIHLPRDASVVGRDRLERLGVEPTVFTGPGTSDDAALLLAEAGGAEVIVTVGSPAGLVPFLDGGRSAMASAFLTRMRVGARVLDAKAAVSLAGGSVRAWQLVLLVLAGLLAVGVSVAATPVGEQWADVLGDQLAEAVGWIRESAPW